MNRYLVEQLEQRRLYSGSPSIVVSDVSVIEGNAGTTNAAVLVSLSGPRGNQIVTVDYSTQNGTAVAGADYSAASGKLSFAAGETTKTILVPVKGDRIAEDNEYFVVNLQGAKNAKILGSQSYVSITDDEPRIAIVGGQVYEGNSGVTQLAVTVNLSGASDQPVAVGYYTQNGTAIAGSDFQNTVGTVTFAAGEISKTINIPVINDRLAEADKYFYVALNGPSVNAAIGWSYPVLCTILDDEPRISTTSASAYEGDAGTTPMIFSVSLSRNYDQAVTVNFDTEGYTAVDGVDYIGISGSLTFAPGEITKTVTVPVIGNTTAEPEKDFSLILRGASANATLMNNTANGAILDDDGFVPPYQDDGGGYFYDWFDYIYYGW